MTVKRIELLFLMLVMLMLCGNAAAYATENPMVSVFDVQQGKVVQVKPLTAQLQNAVIKLLQSSPSIYGGFEMNPTKGIVMHVPFVEPVHIPDEIYPMRIKEAYLFLEPGVKPKALLFLETELRQIIVELESDANKFIQENVGNLSS